MMSVSVSTPSYSKVMSTKGLSGLSSAKKAQKNVLKAATPEGEQREYYIERFDNVGGVTDSTGYLYERVTRETVVYGNDGTVYIPNILAGSYFDEPGWIEGTLSADGSTITVQQNQVLGTYNGYDCTLAAFGSDGYLISGPIEFTVDPDYGIVMMNGGGLMLGITMYGKFYYLTQCGSIYMYPADNKELFAEPATRNVTASMTTNTGTTPVTYTVEDVESSIMGVHYVKGLLSAYPDSWFVVMNDQQSSDLVMLGQVISNDIMAVVYNQQNLYEGPEVVANTQALFTHNSDGSYTFASNNYIADYAAISYDQQTKKYGYGNSCMYTDITLGAPTSSGISSVTTEAKGEPVATEYYDLSGRRVDAAAKGVTIRVDKYADGTSKAVKTIK